MSHTRLLPAGNARDIYGQTIRANIQKSAEVRKARELAKNQKAKRLETEAAVVMQQLASSFPSLGLTAHGSMIFWGSGLSQMIVKPKKLDTEKIALLGQAEAHRVPKPAERVPDMVTCIVGWRGWSVKKRLDELRLEGIGMSHIWTPKKPEEATCKVGTGFNQMLSRAWGQDGPVETNPAPGMKCTCGIWAFRTLEEFQAMAQQYEVDVVGQVYLWGRVLECENGFRAQYAYPKELWLMNKDNESLGHIYNCPVRTL